jgi:hypothetical protein
MSDRMHRSEFLKFVKDALPGLRDAINQQEGLLHLEVGVLRKCAQRAIWDADRDTLSICFRLAEQAYENGDRQLKNAIDVSFVEELEFGSAENRKISAWEMMPVTLRVLYEQFHGPQSACASITPSPRASRL